MPQRPWPCESVRKSLKNPCRDRRYHSYDITSLKRKVVYSHEQNISHLSGLGPGIHSGPVTAGVLRGERARFQLFGDTVNTAARYVTNRGFLLLVCLMLVVIFVDSHDSCLPVSYLVCLLVLMTIGRMESTSLRNRIQLSQATADLLTKAGKSSWMVKRSDEVQAKGKGLMQTYWLKCSVSFPVSKPKTMVVASPEPEPTSSESEETCSQPKELDDT